MTPYKQLEQEWQRLSLALFQERFEIGERLVGGGLGGRPGYPKTGAVAADVFRIFLVLPVMAIQAKVLPVAAVCRIVVMIVVLVMHSELVQVLAGKLPPTARANPGVDSKGLFPVAAHTLVRRPAGISNDLVELFFADRFGHDTYDSRSVSTRDVLLRPDQTE